MKTIINIIFYTTMLVVLGSCQKNIDAFIPDNFQANIDTVWQNNITPNASIFSLRNDLRTVRVKDSFSYGNANFSFSSGVLSLTIPNNSLAKNGTILSSGLIMKESLLATKKGDFIANDLPTISNDRLLVSGGAFYLNLKTNGNDLSIAQGNKITVKFTASSPFQLNKIFNADSVNGTNWILNTDTNFNRSNSTATGYEIETNKTQYVQTAHFMDIAGIGQTTLTLKLPSNYTNTNTATYISFNDETCVAGLKANVSMRAFVSPLLPVNRPVTIVVISKQAGDYYLGSQITTTSFNGPSPSSNIFITPVKRSLDYIKTFLGAL